MEAEGVQYWLAAKAAPEVTYRDRYARAQRGAEFSTGYAAGFRFEECCHGCHTF
jgi:hypothetical protein